MRYASLAQHMLRLAPKFNEWRRPFDDEVISRYSERQNDELASAVWLGSKVGEWRRTINPDAIEQVFSLKRKDHAFGFERLDWGFCLTEPQITRAIKHFLSSGPDEIRKKRIGAFLRALGKTDVDDDDLAQCRVAAEEGRIDLKLVWTDGNGRPTIVIIEVKLGHRITDGQLRNYTDSIAKKYKIRPDCFLLVLNEKSARGLRGHQLKRWPRVKWRDFWIAFEKRRPEEDNANLSMFLNTLWHRIGRLN